VDSFLGGRLELKYDYSDLRNNAVLNIKTFSNDELYFKKY
jgi:hypothetical protein